MPRRKKHTKLPNGYGQVIFIGRNRRRPYAVYPPCTRRVEGRTIRPKAIGYCETYEEGRELLVLYHKGLELPDVPIVPKKGPTFAEVYERYYADKYENPAKKLSIQSEASTKAAYLNASALHDRDFASIKYPELQAVLDNCPLSHSSVELIKSLFRQMYRYAEKYEIVDRDESRHLEIRIPEDDEHGIPFTEEDIARIWSDARQNRPGTAFRLLMMNLLGIPHQRLYGAYSAFRARLVLPGRSEDQSR